MMAVKFRCSVCRRTAEASPTAKGEQRVCCAECRKKRDRMLARRRRRAALSSYRAEESERKRAQRERQRAALTPEPEGASWQAVQKCHAPPSDDNRRKLFNKIARTVDRGLEMSRARLRQQIKQAVWKSAEQEARAGP
jgi:hypothetical protein